MEEGGVVVFPTETVWGIAARPDAAYRIHELKGRDPDKPLQRLLASPAAIGELAIVDDDVRALAARFMPGPLTLVLRAHDGGTVGVRVPDHPVPLALLERTGPLAATSANLSGGPTPTTLHGVQEVFGAGVDVYLDGEPPTGLVASSVLSLAGEEPELLREGAIAAEALEDALGRPIRRGTDGRLSASDPGRDP